MQTRPWQYFKVFRMLLNVLILLPATWIQHCILTGLSWEEAHLGTSQENGKSCYAVNRWPISQSGLKVLLKPKGRMRKGRAESRPGSEISLYLLSFIESTSIVQESWKSYFSNFQARVSQVPVFSSYMLINIISLQLYVDKIYSTFKIPDKWTSLHVFCAWT